MSVTPEEETERIKQILPAAWAGGVWQKDLYANEVQTRTGMAVDQFEKAFAIEMLTDKFRQLVTAGSRWARRKSAGVSAPKRKGEN